MLYFIFINMLDKIWSIEFDINKNNLTKSSILKKCKKKIPFICQNWLKSLSRSMWFDLEVVEWFSTAEFTVFFHSSL